MVLKLGQTHCYFSQFYSYVWLLNACEIWPPPLIYLNTVCLFIKYYCMVHIQCNLLCLQFMKSHLHDNLHTTKAGSLTLPPSVTRTKGHRF